MAFQVGQLVRLDPRVRMDSVQSHLSTLSDTFIIRRVTDEHLHISPTGNPSRVYDSYYHYRFIPAQQQIYRRH